MFKKIEENVQYVEVFQKSLDIKMEYNDIDVQFVKKYFNQRKETNNNSKYCGMNMSGRNKI